MQALVVGHVRFEHLGTISTALDGVGIGYAYADLHVDPTVRVSLDAYAGLILMGGPMSANDSVATYGANWNSSTSSWQPEGLCSGFASARANWNDRTHFFADCAQIMRRILVDYARARRYAKRGGGAPHVSIDEVQPLPLEPGADLVAIDEALEAHSRADARKAKIVELRFLEG